MRMPGVDENRVRGCGVVDVDAHAHDLSCDHAVQYDWPTDPTKPSADRIPRGFPDTGESAEDLPPDIRMRKGSHSSTSTPTIRPFNPYPLMDRISDDGAAELPSEPGELTGGPKRQRRSVEFHSFTVRWDCAQRPSSAAGGQLNVR